MPPSIPLLLGCTLAKASAALAKGLKLGAGSSLPGKLLLKFDSQAVRHLGQTLSKGSLGITGTNGKSTTAGLLAAFLQAAGMPPVHNQLGANMLNGIAGALALQSNWKGELQANHAVLELDEASAAKVTQQLPLQGLGITNLFRDQLDRYGELTTTANLIAKTFPDIQGWVVLNADDPLVTQLAKRLPSHVKPVYLGIESITYAQEPFNLDTDALVPFPAEVSQCPECQAPLHYQQKLYAHLGHYACEACGYQRPKPWLHASVTQASPEGAHFTLTPSEEAQAYGIPAFGLQTTLAGTYNLYNVLMAVQMALLAGVPPERLQPALNAYEGLFGRAEQRTIQGRRVKVFLIKNPTGATEVLRLISSDPKQNVLLWIEDNYADGRDISWLWDAAFEGLANQERLGCTGHRAEDMAVRLKYAGCRPQSVWLESTPLEALEKAIEATPEGGTLYLLPTYTALLQLRFLWEKLESV
jgi:lipid II isoglutaminyl synthase (glutamine-hydrolysing)